MSGRSWYRTEELNWPTQWAEVFGREAELLVEIGFGGGEFLIDLAQRWPEANVLGVEISLPSLRKAVKKIASNGLTHVRLIQGSAESTLWLLCWPNSVGGVFINFPDPWPKRNHHGRQLINDDFLYLLATRMQRGANLEIATDDAAYAVVIASALSRSAHFQNCLLTAYVKEDPARMVTKYERQANEVGRTCHYFKWQRNKKAAPDRFALPQELAMPHMILRTRLDLEEIGRRFEPSAVERGNIRVKFIECYRSLRDEKLLVETFVTEEALQQRVCLSLRLHTGAGKALDASKTEIMIGLHDMGFPRPTRGIHVAIDHLSNWLREIAPGTEVVHSNLVTGNQVIGNR